MRNEEIFSLAVKTAVCGLLSKAGKMSEAVENHDNKSLFASCWEPKMA